jgi:hypothetical protein
MLYCTSLTIVIAFADTGVSVRQRITQTKAEQLEQRCHSYAQHTEDHALRGARR